MRRFLAEAGVGKRILLFVKGAAIYAQGDACDSVYFIQSGTVKLSVVSEQGREATIAIMREGEFLGEEYVSTVQPFRSATAATLTECSVLRIQKMEMLRVLREEPEMSATFVAYILARTSRIQADLVDQLFNFSEKRLARTLLLLANFGQEGVTETVVPQISQDTLAAMVGCTRPRVNFFLNRFRKLGFIEYDHQIKVTKALLQVVLNDQS